MYINCFLFWLHLLFIGTIEMSHTDKVRERITVNFIKEMEKEGLLLAGNGGGQKNGKINLIDVCLKIDKVMDIENARQLIVKCGRRLINTIENEQEYNSYFVKSSDATNLLLLSIIGLQPESPREHIVCVSICKGNIYYDAYNFEDPEGTWLDIHKETFEEAQNILNKSDKDLTLDFDVRNN